MKYMFAAYIMWENFNQQNKKTNIFSFMIVPEKVDPGLYLWEE